MKLKHLWIVILIVILSTILNFDHFIVAQSKVKNSGSNQKQLNSKLEKENIKFPLINKTIKSEATKKSNVLKNKWENTKRIAKKRNIPISKKLLNGEILILDRLEYGKPVYNKFNSLNAAKTISSNKLWWEGNLGYDLTGFGISAGIWDASQIWTGHSEYTLATILNQNPNGYWDASHTHGMTGLLLSAGTSYAPGASDAAKGMAKYLTLHVYDSILDTDELLTAPSWILVSNHSYSANCGWDYDSSGGRWLWWGDTTVNAFEDYKFGFYNEKSHLIDELTNFYNPYRLMITAAGNDRNEEGPGPNGLHYLRDAQGGFTIPSHTTRSEDGGYDKFECIPSDFPTAKNVLTVGAVIDIPNGYNNISDVEIANFSSWGPTDDGRIKPDIVANGHEIICTDIAYDLNDNPIDSYQMASGTSGAAASVTGSCALILEHYEDLFPNRTALLASTLKAIIIHTADEAGNPGPDYKFGWGLMNTKSAVEMINIEFNDGEGTHITERELIPGNSENISIQTTGQDSLVVTLCWSDPAGPYPLNPVLNPTDKRLVNDLDIVLEDPNNNDHYPYKLNPSSPDNIASMGDNDIDNVEKIIVEYPTNGIYTAHISHEGFLQGNQYFSLIVSGGYIKNPIIIPPPPSPDSFTVTYDQKISNGSTVGNMKWWNHWGQFFPYTPPQYENVHINDDFYTIRTATKQIYFGEKFHDWNNNSKYEIASKFHIQGPNDMEITAYLDSAKQVSLYINTIYSSISQEGVLELKDPWFLREGDSQYASPLTLYSDEPYSNLGKNPVFENVDVPININITSDFKGVFLNEGVTPQGQWVKPYYSVRAANGYYVTTEGIYEFSHWEADPVSSAEFQYPNQRETGVVFRSDGAVVKAMYQAVNSIPNYTLTIDQGEELTIPAGNS